jgi:hypothetical protein
MFTTEAHKFFKILYRKKDKNNETVLAGQQYFITASLGKIDTLYEPLFRHVKNLLIVPGQRIKLSSRITFMKVK